LVLFHHQPVIFNRTVEKKENLTAGPFSRPGLRRSTVAG
jgi:hypothetical protein